MLSGIREICIVTNPHDLSQFHELLGDGRQFGIQLSYVQQSRPEGLPQALVLTESFVAGEPCCLILGDNLFYGPTLGYDLQKYSNISGAHVFGYQVSDPERYGVAELDQFNKIKTLEEKPKLPKSNLAIPGLYYFDKTAAFRSKTLQKSSRDEFEMMDLLKSYLNDGELNLTVLPRGTAWLDTGNPEALHDASAYIKTVQERQGLLISSPEEIALRNSWITVEELAILIDSLGKTRYAEYLKNLVAG